MWWKKWQNEWDDSLERKLKNYDTRKRNPRNWDSEQMQRDAEYRSHLKSFRLCPDYVRPETKLNHYPYTTLLVLFGLLFIVPEKITHFESGLRLVLCIILLNVLRYLPPPRELWFKTKLKLQKNRKRQ